MSLQTVQARGQITLTRDIRQAAGISAGDLLLTRVIRPGVVELTRVPRLKLDELLERFHFDGPVDEPSDREAWQHVAAQETLGHDG